MTTPHEESPAGLPRRNMIGAGLGVLGGVAALSALSTPTAEAAAVQALYFQTSPTRVLDTRLDGDKQKYARGERLDVPITNALATLPQPLNRLLGYVAILSVAVTQTVNVGHLRFWQTSEPEPNTSNVNWFGSNQTLANQAFVGIGTALSLDNDVRDKFSIRVGGPSTPPGATHIVVDVFGFFVGNVPLPIRKGKQ